MGRPRSVADSQLLDAAMQAFWRDGYDGVSTRALEAATGLPASSLYHRFGSKDGLFAAALDHYLARVVDARIRRHLAQDDALAGLRDFFTSVYRARGPYRACLLANTLAEPAARLPAIAPRVAAGTERLQGALAVAVRRGIAQQSLRRDLDVTVAAGYLLTALYGLLATARHVQDPARLDAQVDLVLGALR